jgi:hypothetical protein
MPQFSQPAAADGPHPCRRFRIPGRSRAPVAAALLAVVTLSVGQRMTANVEAAGTRARSGPGKFLDTLMGREQEPREFIPAPVPPTAAEAERAGKFAALPAKPKADRAPVAAPARPPSVPARLPTWPETVAFGAGVGSAARKVAADAVNPRFVPSRPMPAPPAPPATVIVPPSPSSRRQTPPIVATRLQPTGKPAPRTQRFERLRTRINQTLAAYQRRPLNTAQHTPWEVMHGFIAFGIPTQIRVGGPGGDLVNAIGWSNMGGRCKGQVMLAASGDRLTAQKGIGVQGHSAQYLAILAQCRVAANSPISIQSKQFTVADLIAEEKLSCKAGTELTFALIALAHYLPTDAEWHSRDGVAWTLEKLVEEEIEQPIRGAPCGGTHRLFGLAYGCQRRLRATGALDGAYLRADKYVRDYQTFALTKLQNRDGSFSTEWFKYPADRDDDIDRKIQTTGHILEWLVGSLDQERLYEPRVVAATEFLVTALAREPSRDWKLGPLGHALHALTIYQERAWGTVLPGGIAAFNGPMKAAPAAAVATQPEGSSQRGKRR